MAAAAPSAAPCAAGGGEERRGAKTPEEDEKISPAVDFVAAGLVSSISKIIVYPMETKVLLIAIGADASVASGAQLWHGVVVKALENFGYNGLLWFLKEAFRPQASDSETRRPPTSFWGAFGASCIAILFAHPFANVSSGMQASLRHAGRPPMSALAVARQTLRAHGPGGFFQGWQYSFVMRVGAAMTFVVYEFVRRRTCRLLGGDASNLLAGLLGRLAEVWTCHPLKTLRSRQQNGQPALPSLSLGALVGLWSGVGTQGFADAVKIGIRFLFIERLRTLLQRLLDSSTRQKKRGRLADAAAAAKAAPAAKDAGVEDDEGPPQAAVGA